MDRPIKRVRKQHWVIVRWRRVDLELMSHQCTKRNIQRLGYLEPKRSSVTHMHSRSLNLCFLGPRVYRRLNLSNVIVYECRVILIAYDDRQRGCRRHVLDLPNFIPHRRQRVGLNRRSKFKRLSDSVPLLENEEIHACMTTYHPGSHGRTGLSSQSPPSWGDWTHR